MRGTSPGGQGGCEQGVEGLASGRAALVLDLHQVRHVVCGDTVGDWTARAGAPPHRARRAPRLPGAAAASEAAVHPEALPGALGAARRSLLSMMLCSRVWGSWATAWSRYCSSLLMLDTGMPKDCTNSSSCCGSRSCRAAGSSPQRPDDSPEGSHRVPRPRPVSDSPRRPGSQTNLPPTCPASPAVGPFSPSLQAAPAHPTVQITCLPPSSSTPFSPGPCRAIGA